MDWIEIGYYVLLVTAVVVINRLWDNAINKQNEKKMAEENIHNINAEDQAPSDPKTMLLLTETLKQLNLKVDFDTEDKDVVRTDYQGEHFIIKVENNKFIEVRDLFWYEAPLDDLDNLSIIYKVTNWCNLNTSCRMIYSLNEKENTINIHTLTTLLWIPEIPEIEQYLEATLAYMLKVKHIFYTATKGISIKFDDNTNSGPF